MAQTRIERAPTFIVKLTDDGIWAHTPCLRTLSFYQLTLLRYLEKKYIAGRF
jgi:hypothetical protein